MNTVTGDRMDVFLLQSSSALKTHLHGNQRIHVVLGSESCDLDSVVSSLAMAYFLYRTSSGPPSGPIVVPVLNIPRSQLHLRFDVVLLLREAGIAMETLVFRDEVDLARLHGDRRLALTLVDHNMLSSSDSILHRAVVEILDHHQLERTASYSCPVTMETVASCATLVTGRILSRAPEILDRQLALLLYGVIVVDSVNLSKATVKDSQTVRLLQTRFPDLPPGGALHSALKNARFNTSGLSTEQILLRDMETVTGGDLRVALSIVYMGLDSFLLQRKLQQQLCDFCCKYRLDAVVAMTTTITDQSEEFIRQLAVYSANPLYRQQISHALCSSQSPALCLSPVSSPYKDILAYQQDSVSTTRMHLLPILKHFLTQMHCGPDIEDQREELDDQSMMMMMVSEPTAEPADDHSPHLYSISQYHRRRLQLGTEDYGSPEEDYGGRAMRPPPNSLVEGCPLEDGFSQEALLEKFSCMRERKDMENTHI
ncbi:exopolyphosphatase PRUNE1-like isoform X2 [Sphaeramia orbicularis]|uniref:Exopolyphosphatase PRUNE1-like n=1 Tax=Sphaeramia orbicularis TaxID=375764 RepID=A0A672YHK6_9TELE|nr:exopolyphosphatase PRUNE1-like isoform X2 [Sphaeramia orbicularis]